MEGLEEAAQRLRGLAARLRCLSCLWSCECRLQPRLDCPHYEPLAQA